MKKICTPIVLVFFTLSCFCQVRYFHGTLSGVNEVPPNASTASGMVIVKFNTASKIVELYGNYNGLTTAVSGSHIHTGAAGVNGPVIVNLNNTGGMTGTLTGSGTLTAGQETDLLAANLYVNVHSSTFTGGEIRSQLLAVPDGQAMFLNARLQGAQEVPPNPSAATGMATILLDKSNNKVYLTGNYTNLVNTVSGSHIHLGRSGINGGVILGLTNSGGMSGTIHGEGTLTAAQKDSMIAASTYVNVHSSTYPGGEIRGQVTNYSQQLFSGGRLMGANEVPPNASVATGTVITRYNMETNEIELTGDYQNLTTAVTGSHIHVGSAGINGGVILNLNNTGGTSGLLSATGSLTAAHEDSLLNGRLYVNVHSSTFPGGEIRTQLLPGTMGETQYFQALLTGSQEVPPNASTAFGGVVAMVDKVTGQAYISGFYSGLTNNISGSHVHRAPTGTNGPIIIHLSNTGLTDGTFSGSQVLSPALVDSFINGFTYVNIHSTPSFAGGEIRAQLGSFVLPVKLNYFNGYKQNTAIMLVWESLQEENLARYEIEQQNTVDGTWLLKTIVTAGNTPNGQKYTTEDVPVNYNQAYVIYRLKMIDKDGKVSFSPVVKINFLEAKATIVLQGNPVKDMLSFQVTGYGNDKKADATIIDQAGRIGYKETINVVKNQRLNISNLQSGMYTLLVELDGVILRQRFIKQ